MSIYNVIRNIHLFSALVIGLFVLMYFVTGGVMLMDHMFPRSEAVTTQTVVLQSQGDARDIERIRKQFSIGGYETSGTGEGGQKVITWNKPGFRAALKIAADQATAAVEIERGTFGAIMNDLHRIRGYDKDVLRTAWAFLYDLASISLVVFAFTGLFLGLKMPKERGTTIICLLISTALTAFAITYLMMVG